MAKTVSGFYELNTNEIMLDSGIGGAFYNLRIENRIIHIIRDLRWLGIILSPLIRGKN